MELMKIAPVSGDMLLKVAAGAVLVGGLVYLVTKITGAASGAVGSVVDSVTEAASTTFNPASDQNFIYESVNWVGGSISGSKPGEWSLGTWIYDITHDDPLTLPPKNTGGATGGW